MLNYKIKKFIYERLNRIFKKNYVRNFNPYNVKTNLKALLYYKYDRDFLKATPGTTLYQSLKIAKALNKNNYLVTVVDRSQFFKINEKYDIFIGAFNTGGFRFFENFVNSFKNKNTKIIALSTGANPEIMKKNFKERVKNFYKRNKVKLNHYTRFNNNLNINKIFKHVNYLIYFGYRNGFVDKSYQKFNNIKKFEIQSCISDQIKFDLKKLKKKKINLKNFLFYSGSSYIHKGLDLIIEAFKQDQSYNLFICCPKEEKEFLEFYEIQKYKNIHYIGNVEPNSNLERKIFNKCSYIVSCNCSGGSAASLSVGRRYGLVPIVSLEEDCNYNGCIIIKKNNLTYVIKMIKKASNLKINEFKRLSRINYKISFDNSEQNYDKRISRIINHINNK
jgi:hypothetical protein